MAELWFGGEDIEYRVVGRAPRLAFAGTQIDVSLESDMTPLLQSFILRDGSTVSELRVTPQGQMPVFRVPNSSPASLFVRAGGGPITEIFPTATSLIAMLQEQIASIEADPGQIGIVLTQDAPAATWTFPNPRGRIVGITLYIGDEEVGGEVSVTPEQIVVTWPFPVAGRALVA